MEVRGCGYNSTEAKSIYFCSSTKTTTFAVQLRLCQFEGTVVCYVNSTDATVIQGYSSSLFVQRIKVCEVCMLALIGQENLGRVSLLLVSVE